MNKETRKEMLDLSLLVGVLRGRDLRWPGAISRGEKLGLNLWRLKGRGGTSMSEDLTWRC